MMRVINVPDKSVDDMLGGVLLHRTARQRNAPALRMLYAALSGDAVRVGVATRGGSGHRPLFLGFVESGLVDPRAVLKRVRGPSPMPRERAICCTEQAAWFPCFRSNCDRNRMNVALACDRTSDKIATRTVLGNDDLIGATPDDVKLYRSVAGLVLVAKAAGHAAAAGAPLDELTDFATRAVARTRAIGATFDSCFPSGSHQTNFEAPDQVEMSMGVESEAGSGRRHLASADNLALVKKETHLDSIVPDRGEVVVPMLNSLGATPLAELMILLRKVRARLLSVRAQFRASFVGPWFRRSQCQTDRPA